MREHPSGLTHSDELTDYDRKSLLTYQTVFEADNAGLTHITISKSIWGIGDEVEGPEYVAEHLKRRIWLKETGMDLLQAETDKA